MQVTAETVAGFVGSILAPKFEDSCASPEFHTEMWELCCSKNKFVAIAAPRGQLASR